MSRQSSQSARKSTDLEIFVRLNGVSVSDILRTMELSSFCFFARDTTSADHFYRGRGQLTSSYMQHYSYNYLYTLRDANFNSL